MNHYHPNTPSRFLLIPTLATAFLVTACGGSGGGGGNPVRARDVSASASRLTANPTAAVAADGSTRSEITVVVLDTNGSPLANQLVALEVSGSGNLLDPASGTSDAQGAFRSALASTTAERKEVTARVNAGSPAAVTLLQKAPVAFIAPDTPVLAGVGRYEDSNRNGQIDRGDRLILPFSTPVVVRTSRPADLALQVADDTFGTGASVLEGPASNEVSVLLGDTPVLRTRGAFRADTVTANSPSGIDVAAIVTGIVSASSQTPALASGVVDIVPALHAEAKTAAALGAVDAAVGDLDGDGDLDAWVGTSGTNRLLLRNDAGALVDSQQFGNLATRSVVVADLDHFGAVDIVTAHDTFVQLWLNRTTSSGTPNIVQATTLSAGQARAVVVADFGGDGFGDVLVATNADVRLFTNQRNLGVDMLLTQTLAVANANAMATVDIDGDEDVDVLVATDAGVRLLRNNAGTLALSTVDTTLATSIAVGDVNADRDPDVVASGGGVARLLRNEGDGTFTAVALSMPAERVRLADLDGDARADLITSETNAVAVHFATNGGFVRDAQRIAGAKPVTAITDLDLDGDLDLLAVSADAVHEHTGSLRGTFGTTTYASTMSATAGVSTSVARGDLDDDGIDDLVVGGTGEDLVLLGDGVGGFTFSGLARHRLGAGSTAAVAIADMDADGDLDVVTVERFVAATATRWRVWLNDGTGAFPLTIELPHAPTDAAQALALGDVTGDGVTDVIVGCSGANLVFRNVTLNGQRLFFQTANAFPPATNDRDTRALAMIDIDDDGDLDLVVGNFGATLAAQANQVFRLAVNNGLPAFGEFALPGIEPTVAVVVADFDGDGLKDLICANADDGNTFQHRIHTFGRRSTSAVGQALRFTSGSPATSMDARDIDGDGRPDLVMGTADGKVQVWRQTGPLQFAVVQELQIDDVRALATGDFDHDGDIDVFAATGADDLVLQNH